MTFPTIPESLAPADEPLVVQAMRRHKLDLLRREGEQLREMVRRWRQVEDRLEAEMLALSGQISELVEAGQSVNQARVLRVTRYQTLLLQASDEVDRYMARQAEDIASRQFRLGQLGIAHASEAINLSYVQAGRTAIRFNVLPVEAVENMVGSVASGAPLGDYLRQNARPEALDGMTRKLIEGVALGRNPRVVARSMRDGLAGGLNSAMNTARTEQLRVYREASRRQYQRSGVVTSYRRISARDTRVCPACLFADGRRYDLGESLDEHNQGRCAMIPDVRGIPPTSWQFGQSWFVGQDAGVQRQILGTGRYDAWQEGAFELDDVVGRREDSTWGNSLVPRSLQELTSGSGQA